MKEPGGFNKAREAAEALAREHDKLQNLLDNALIKADNEKGRIVKFWEDLQLLIRMLRSYLRKEYTRLPWKTIVFSVAAVLYFLNPLDMIPDLVPALGFLDDATVVAFVMAALKDDLLKFKEFAGQEAALPE